ncbi:MAG TPA: YlxR family protein [Armatimonadota bacterium]|nr:YlxR family protein [Armatimonadota bacterium]
MRPRRVPIRTCTACRTSGDKKGLLRVVRTPAGEVKIDETGKMAGRGTYLCPSSECLRRAMKEKRLSRALKTEIPEEILRQLEQMVEQGSERM